MRWGHCGSFATVVAYVPLVMAAVLLAGTAYSDDAVRFEDLPKAYAPLEEDWRESVYLSEGEPHDIIVGTVQESCVLRLSILPDPATQVRTRIYVGDTMFKELVPPQRSPGWQDWRVRLDGPPGALCRVVLESASPFWAYGCELVTADAEKPNVLVYLIDALRQDHLGCYGYGRDTSPNIDAFAEESLKFTQAMPQSSLTKPSVASLFTSAYPQVHGARIGDDAIREGLPTLAQGLQNHGYETVALVANFNCIPQWGFGTGFSRFVLLDALGESGDAVVAEATMELFRHVRGRPWFLYVHAMGPHAPYGPPPPYDSRFVSDASGPARPDGQRQRAVDLYDGEIAHSDAQFGRVVVELKRLDTYENTLIVLLSDHGEEFWDHEGNGHGKTLYEEMLRVPLLVKMPVTAGGMGGGVRDSLVQHIDIAPTIVDIVGAPAERQFRGRSFLELIRKGDAAPQTGYASLLTLGQSIRVAKTPDQKYILDVLHHRQCWYSLKDDPSEQHPRSEPLPGGEELFEHVENIAAQGVTGLHILVTTGFDYTRPRPETDRTITGWVRAEGMDGFDLQYYDWKSSVSREGDTVHFAIQTQHPEDGAHRALLRRAYFLEQDNAHLRVDVNPDQDLWLDLRVNGQPVSVQDVFVGRDMASASLDEARLRPGDIQASLNAFDPAGLPKRFGVYVWYVGEGKTVPLNGLNPAVLEKLKAMGYLE